MDELEAALLARWERSTLVVYADALQARGDPRGELIALDLQLDLEYSHELALRRRARLFEWLGSETIADRRWHEASFRYGFAIDFVAGHAEQLEALFASPAGRYVKKLSLVSHDSDALVGMFDFVSREPRLWLERLDVLVSTRDPTNTDANAALIATTPRLHTLGLTCAHARFGLPGEPTLILPHPGVRTVACTSQLLPHLARIPNVKTLDLLLEGDDRADNESGLRPEITQAIFELRGLTHLDLSRTEPRGARGSPANVDVYPLLGGFPYDHIATLRLPSLRDQSQLRLLGDLIEQQRTVEVTIARAYRMVGKLQRTSHPTVRFPQPYWWPPRDAISTPDRLHVDDLEVSLIAFIALLEHQFESLPPASRSAIRDLWEFLEVLPYEATPWAYPVAPLLTAIEAIDDVDPYSGQARPWAQLAEKLRTANHQPGATVGVRREWRW